jgi:hypothetical protein
MPRWLSMHVAYACRHRGACCAAAWPVPVERLSVPDIDRAVDEGRLRAIDGVRAWLTPHPSAPDEVAGTFRHAADGRCVFHHRQGEPGGSCAVHAALGHDRLPAACQHFPRVCLLDDRDVHVTLSHFCPTAAGLLVDADAPVRIVEGPPPVPGREQPEGLDVRGQFPPLLSPGVLMDADGYEAWEAHLVEALAGARPRGGSAEAAVDLLARDALLLGAWRPGAATLAETIAGLPVGPTRPTAVADPLELFETARAACDPPWTWPATPDDVRGIDRRLVEPVWPSFDRVLRRYLAAHAFASGAAYHAGGLGPVVRSIARAGAVLRVEAARAAGLARRNVDEALLLEAIRQADLLLRHYADPVRLARA